MSRNNTFDAEQLTDAAYYILLSLTEEKHGYAIMQYIDELTDKAVNIGPATLYTLLKKMNSNALINQVDEVNDRKKKYKISSKGFALLKKEVVRRDRMVKHGVRILNNIEGKVK